MDTGLKTNLVNEIRYSLSDHIDAHTLQKITNIILIKLNDYEITPKCTDIVVKETESEQIIKMFLATKKIEGRSLKTLDNYGRRLMDLLNVVNKPVDEMQIFDLRMYLASKQMGGCSDRSVSGYRSVLTSFFNWAYSEQLIKNNPCLNLGVIKYRREVKQPYTKIDIEKLRESCATIRDRTIIETLLATGCRIGELTQIKTGDVNFDAGEIKVLGKGNKERIVYIDSVTSMWIKKYLDTRCDDSEMLFIGKGRSKITCGGIRAMLTKLSETSGVVNVHPHRFRRTLATTLIERGMKIEEVANILGHENINTTMTYVYLDKQKVKASYNKFSA